MRDLPLLAALSSVVMAVSLSAQVREFPYRSVPTMIDSGHVANRDLTAHAVFTHVVRSKGATWLRLRFGTATQLDGNSFVRISSLKDGYLQLFETWSLRDYRNASSYFNGDAVLVELVAGAFTSRNRLVIDQVEHGEVLVEPKSQCGPQDNRTPSTDPRAARQFPTGCTTWLISKFACCTAGHCTSNANQTMQFNVPLSSSNGRLNHPPPSEQYPYDAQSLRRLSAGIGADWAVAATLRNSTTSLYAGEKQGSWFELERPPTSATIRITGYGVDRDQRNRTQTQQTHAGPLSYLRSTRLCYVVDTEGGNSGSPVINDTTGKAVGIHTHGGCSTNGSGCNSGTAILGRTDFINAMNAVLNSRIAGSYDEFGAACKGTGGTPKLENGTIGPEIGRSFQARMTGLSTSKVVLLVFGVSDKKWGAVNLPLKIGTTGCTLYVSIDTISAFLTSNRTATWNVSVPNSKSLIGMTWFNQIISIDPKINALGLTTSNAAKAVIGGVR